MKKQLQCAALAAAIVLGGFAGFHSASSASGEGLIPLKKYGVTVDREHGLLVGIPGNPTADALCAMFDGGDDVKITNANGVVLARDDLVPTGAVVSSGSDSVRAVIYGDVGGDAAIDLVDAVAILQNAAGWDTEIDENAADVDCNGSVDASDVVTILRYIAGWRVYLGGVGMTVITEPQIAANEAHDLTLAFGNGIDKYTPDSDIGDAATYLMNCAKGEIEFTQFSIAAESAYSGLTLQFTPFTNAKGETVRTEMFFEKFTNLANAATYAEVLEPYLTDISIRAGAHQPFGIKAYPDADSSYGLYESEISLIDADGHELKRALVYLNVWDFELPKKSSMRTSIGMSEGAFRWGNISAETAKDMYRVYYEYFLENRMNPVVMPYGFDDPEVTKYLNDDRVNAFLVGGEGYGGQYDRTAEQIETAYNLMKDNPEWLEKGYFYFDDEPAGVPGKPPIEEQFDSIKTHYEFARSIFPGAKLVIPNHYNYDYGDIDIVGFVMQYSSILCPHTWMFTNPDSTDVSVWYTREMEQKYGTLKDRIAKKLAEDETAEFWWYTSDNPRDTYCNLTTSKPGIENRTLFWQQYLYGSEGFLYWLANEWNNVSRDCTYVAQEHCGLLVYPYYFYVGNTTTPIGSIRLELARDGIEDFDYLHLIEEKFGKDVADSFVAKVTSGLREYSTDSSVLEEVRIEMGEMLQGWN